MKRWTVLALAALLSCALLPGPAFASGERLLRAYVSILPQAYFVSRVGGPAVEVKVLVGPGQSHETYEPTPRQIASLAKTDVYFTIGAPFERNLVGKVKGMFPGLAIVDAGAGVPLVRFAPGSGERGLDPHIWLDPKRARAIARNVCEGLKRIDPGRAGEYDRNLGRLLKDLSSLDEELTRILAPVKGRTVYVFHPAFQYFCLSYGLRQEAFEVEGKEPTARQMAKLIGRARQEGVKVVFAQPQFSRKSASAIARAIGGRVVTLDPLPGDYPKDMKTLATAVRDSLRETGDRRGANP